MSECTAICKVVAANCQLTHNSPLTCEVTLVVKYDVLTFRNNNNSLCNVPNGIKVQRQD